MESVTPPGDPANIIVIGEAQGYRGLAVHFGKIFDHAYERETPQLTTAYIPSDVELEAIKQGAPIVINLINVTQHPPIMVTVGDIPTRLKWSIISDNERCVSIRGRHYFAMRCNRKKPWRIDEMNQADPNGSKHVGTIGRGFDTTMLNRWLRDMQGIKPPYGL